MTLRLAQDWIWDSWPVDDEQGRHHLFFLRADRALIDPELRHRHPTIGHAVSDDYRTWQLLDDALAPADTPAWDDGTTWTGSVVRGPSGRYHLFYTGTSIAEDCLVQRIGRADSDDLIHWERFGDQPLVEADPRHYEKLGTGWHDEAWRDPWVFPDPGGTGWHMMITARANHGALCSRGVIGHAWSADLDHWQVRPPLSQPSGFGQLEVTQPVVLAGRAHLLFSCGHDELHPDRHPPGQRGGCWLAPGASLLGPWDIDHARRIDHDSLYAAHVITDVDGVHRLIGFSGGTPDRFVGEILDPVDIAVET